MLPSLNLLPTEHKKEIRRAKMFLFIHEIILFIFIAIVLGSATLLAARLMLEQKFREVVIEKTPGTTKISRLNRNIQNINQRLIALEEITQKSATWSDTILKIITQTPPQINYKSFSIFEDKSIKLHGTADTRDALMNFKNTLESSDYIASVDLPLRYLVKTQDIDFNLKIILSAKPPQ